MWTPTICIFRPVETDKVSVVGKSLKLRWQLAARLGLHVLLMHLKRVASAVQRVQVFDWSLVARLLLRRGYPGLTQLEKHRH